MNKIIFPDPKTITATIDDDISKFDFSYSDELRSLIANEMDIDEEMLKDIRYCWFTNYQKVSNEISTENNFGQHLIAASFKPKCDLILMSIDVPKKNVLGNSIHETGHFLTLHDSYTTIAEGCAMYYERKWYLKNGNLNEFKEKYKNIETYHYSLYLLDLLKNSIFSGDENTLLSMVSYENDTNFYNYINSYLQRRGSSFTIEELLFLADIMHYHRNNLYQSRTFKEKKPYFYKIFDELYQTSFPILFNNNSTPNSINLVNQTLTEYIEVAKKCLLLLNNVKCNSEEYKDLSKIYTIILAEEFHKWDENQTCNNNTETLENFKNRIPHDALIRSLEAYITIQNKETNRSLS